MARTRKPPRLQRDRLVTQHAIVKMQRVIEPFLARMRQPIAEQVIRAVARVRKADDPGAWFAALSASEQAAVLDRILAGLDLRAWGSLAPGVSDILASVAKDGALLGFGQINVTATFELTSLVNDKAVAWANDRGAELVGMRVNRNGDIVPNPKAEWRIDDGTRTLLRGDVREAIEQGTSTADFADDLIDSYAFSPERAERIARTEIARADVQGNIIAYRASGVVSGKEWVLSSEHDGADECDDAADIGTVGLDEDFDGLGDPPLHPGCACDVLPVLMEADPDDDEQ